MNQIEIKTLLHAYFSYRDEKNIDNREINNHSKVLFSLCLSKRLEYSQKNTKQPQKNKDK